MLAEVNILFVASVGERIYLGKGKHVTHRFAATLKLALDVHHVALPPLLAQMLHCPILPLLLLLLLRQVGRGGGKTTGAAQSAEEPPGVPQEQRGSLCPGGGGEATG